MTPTLLPTKIPSGKPTFEPTFMPTSGPPVCSQYTFEECDGVQLCYANKTANLCGMFFSINSKKVDVLCQNVLTTQK